MARRVLLIDDQPLQFRLTKMFFEEFRTEKYELEWADSYDAGLERLAAGDYAACLLDFQLGSGGDGLQLLKEALARGCATPIVFLTTESSEKTNIEALQAGALDYLLKDEITPRSLERSMRYAVKLGETMAALRWMAAHDELTGLPNRREFHRTLARERAAAQEAGRPLSLILTDVDGFKEVNDGHGHPAGDAALVEVARRLGSAVHADAKVMRFGGDEFALILAPADRAEGVLAAGRAVAAVGGAPFALGGDLELPLTLSAGVAVFPDHATGEQGLIAAADRALYAAKEAGRNRVVCSGEPT